MAEPDPAPEGWSIPQARPAVVAVAALALLLIMLLVAGWFYRQNLQPRRHQPVTTFPAPGIEAFIHDGAADPHRPQPKVRPDPAIETAKRAVVADGLSGWETRR